jgi:hypothetical protein
MYPDVETLESPSALTGALGPGKAGGSRGGGRHTSTPEPEINLSVVPNIMDLVLSTNGCPAPTILCLLVDTQFI